jgi:cell division protein FtsN
MKSISTLFTSILFSLFLFSILAPLETSWVTAGGAPQFYTIQISSFVDQAAAEKKYQGLVNSLPEYQLDHLRIEKVQEFYTVRIGKFASRAEAEELLAKAGEPLAGAIVLKAYIGEGRIVRMYKPEQGSETASAKGEIVIPPRVETNATAEQLTEAGEIDEAPLKAAGLEADEHTEYFTIQVGSYSGIRAAEKRYQDLASTLNDKEGDYLRIERVGSYYTVRLGRFDSREAAEDLLAQLQDVLPEAMVLQAFIKDERIARLYQYPASGLQIPVQEELPIEEHPEVVVLEQSSETFEVVKATEEPLPSATFDTVEYYTIQVGSYSGIGAAEKRYQDLAVKLNDKEGDYLRIERVGSYYTVRLGRFDSREAAEDLLAQLQDILPGAMVLQAFIKEERILAIYRATPEVSITTGQEADVFEPAPVESAKVLEPEEDPVEEIAADVPSTYVVVAESAEQPDAAIAVTTEEAEADISVLTIEPDSEPLEIVAGDEDTEEISEVEGDAPKYIPTVGQPAGILPVRVVKVIYKAMFGDRYKYPVVVQHDSQMDEIYVIGGAGMHPSSRIMIYGPDHFPTASLGDGRSVFTPRGLDVDSQGNIYVTQSESDGKPHRLTVLNGAFFITDEFFIDENIPDMPEDFYPRSIALAAENIYITGNNYPGVLVLDRQLNFQGWLVPKLVKGRLEIISDPKDPDALPLIDVVVDSTGKIYLLSPDEGRIYVLDKDQQFLFAFGSKGGSTGKLSRPMSLAVDENREIIYVIDYMRHSVNIYNYKNGKYLFEIGGRGLEPGWFNYPNHIDVDRRGNLIVADYFNHRVQILYVP